MKKYIKLTVIVILSIVIFLEVGYIVKNNILVETVRDTATEKETAEPSELPIVVVTPRPEKSE